MTTSKNCNAYFFSSKMDRSEHATYLTKQIAEETNVRKFNEDRTHTIMYNIQPSTRVKYCKHQ